jgi:hypothetical protein
MKEYTRPGNGLEPARFALAHPVILREIPTSQKLPRHKRGQEFLCGPVPLPWLRQAAMLRGKALAVGIALWFKAGVTKRREVKATGTLWGKLGIHRKSAYRGLSALETSGLITVVRHAGRAPVVTIVEVASPTDK